MSLCRGLVPQPPVDCLAYGGNIIQCFEEGTEKIPGPVENFHANIVTGSSISLEWVPNEEDSNYTINTKTRNIDFIVQYGKVNNMTLYETVVKMENVCGLIEQSFNYYCLSHFLFLIGNEYDKY